MIAVSEGQDLPVLERKLELSDLMAYGAATWDWHPLHYDAGYVERLGLQAPVVDGQMFGTLLAKQLMDWLGSRAFITNLALRYKSMVFAGETVSCEGRVTTVAERSIEVSQTVRVGDRVAVEATARVNLGGDPGGATGGATPIEVPAKPFGSTGGATPSEVPAKPLGSEWESRNDDFQGREP